MKAKFLLTILISLSIVQSNYSMFRLSTKARQLLKDGTAVFSRNSVYDKLIIKTDVLESFLKCASKGKKIQHYKCAHPDSCNCYKLKVNVGNHIKYEARISRQEANKQVKELNQATRDAIRTGRAIRALDELVYNQESN